MPEPTIPDRHLPPGLARNVTAPARLYSMVLVCAWIGIVFIAGGATCARRQTLQEFAPPIVFDQTPSLPDVINQVNRSLAINQLESNTLTVTSPDIITKLTGNMKWDRPDKFNLEAYPVSKLMGIALAAGSNDEMFWLQTQMPSPPTIYYARHDSFDRQQGPRKILPVSPLWLREALGVVEIDPAGRHEGPSVRADGKLELVSYIPTPTGDYQRVLILDSPTGTIEQTLLYNQTGKLVAVAQQSEHEYFSEVDFSLPHKVNIQLHPDAGPPLVFTVEVGFYLLNQPNEENSESFQPPDPTGISTVNLVEVNAVAQPVTAKPPVYRESKDPAMQSTLEQFRTLR